MLGVEAMAHSTLSVYCQCCLVLARAHVAALLQSAQKVLVPGPQTLCQRPCCRSLKASFSPHTTFLPCVGVPVEWTPFFISEPWGLKKKKDTRILPRLLLQSFHPRAQVDFVGRGVVLEEHLMMTQPLISIFPSLQL